MTAKTSFNIAYIGGGSRGWAKKLILDLALEPRLKGEVRLYDIDRPAAEINQTFGNWLQDQPGVVSRWNYVVTETLEEALTQADFVVISIQPGPLEIMAEEITASEQYGLYYPVGDTSGAPGLARGLRSVSIFSGFAKAISAVCPDAWVINYTNPMSVCTRTLMRTVPGLKVFGCCHEVFSTQKIFAHLLSEELLIQPAPLREEIKLNVFGINHFTWVNQAKFQDIDLLQLLKDYLSQPNRLRFYTQEEVEGWNDWFHSADRVKFELFNQFGSLAAAGDRHLVEFLPGFIHSPQTLFQWGVIRTPVSWRIQRWNSAHQELIEILHGKKLLDLQPSGEEGVSLIKALAGIGDVITNVNLPNQGQISNLPLEAVVETNALFSFGSVTPLSAGAVPDGLKGILYQHMNNQELIISSILDSAPELAFQAFCNDPSITLCIDQTRELFHHLVHINRDYLPQGFKRYYHEGQ